MDDKETLLFEVIVDIPKVRENANVARNQAIDSPIWLNELLSNAFVKIQAPDQKRPLPPTGSHKCVVVLQISPPSERLLGKNQ